MKYTAKAADELLCKILGISIQDTLDYDILFTVIDFIEATEHPKYKGYNFCFNMDKHHVWINLGANTNGLEGYFLELFPSQQFRIDAIRKVLFEWVNWYNSLSSQFR